MIGITGLRTGISALAVFGFALALAGIAHAQKTVLPGYPSTPPPKQALPGNPTTPPPMRSPETEGSYRGSQDTTVGQGRPMPGGISREDARGRFQQCINVNTRNGTLSGQGLAGCVSAWMPPAELARFNTCWNDPKTSAWECFGRAYN